MTFCIRGSQSLDSRVNTAPFIYCMGLDPMKFQVVDRTLTFFLDERFENQVV